MFGLTPVVLKGLSIKRLMRLIKVDEVDEVYKVDNASTRKKDKSLHSRADALSTL